MTWTIKRLKRAGILDEITEEGMARLEHLVESGTLENWVPADSHISPDDAFNEEYRTHLTAQWEKTGLLKNIEGERPRFLMSQLLENQTSYLKFISEEGNCTTLAKEDQTLLTHIALPIVIRAFATLVHFPSFGVISTPAALDKRHVPILSVTRKLKVIMNPDAVGKIQAYSGLDAEAELCQLLGEYTKREFSTIILENTLQGRDTYWYMPFGGAHQFVDPQSGIRRIGFMTRYATSTEKPNDN